MKRIVMAAIIISLANKSYSQFDDGVLSFNYMLAPIGNDGTEFNKTNLKINIPVTLKRGLLNNSLGLDYYQFEYNKDYSFSTEGLSKFYDIHYGLMYSYRASSNWVLNGQLKTSIVSNLADAIDFDDLYLSGEVSVTRKINEEEKPALLKIGLMYSAITGQPSVLPVMSYTKLVNEKFTYSIGFPKAFAEYKINGTSTLNSFLLLDGFYANLTSPLFINNFNEVSKASFTSTSLGVEYNHIMDNSWIISFKTGYSLNNNYTLKDSKGNDFFDFNTKSKPFFSTGIKYNFKKHAKITDYEKQ
jgi:hypothetical protein